MKIYCLAGCALASVIQGMVFASELEEVVTIASRTQQLLGDVPANITVIEEQLMNVNHEHVQQVLNQLAGINLQHGSGQEYLPAIRSPVLTGAGACGAFLMTENSIPLRAAGFCNVNELFEAHTEQAQQIEVLRGPGTALHGSNAMHGIVNVISIPRQSEVRNSLAIDNGSYGYWRARLKLSGANAGLKLTTTHDDGWRAESGYDQIKLTAYNSVDVNGLEFDSGISVTHLEQETAGFIVGLNAFKDSAIAKQNLDPEAYRNVDSFRFWTEITSNTHKRWKISPYLRVTDMDFLQHFLPGKPLEQNGQKSLGILSQYKVTPELTVGIDAELTEAFLKQGQISVTEGSVFLQETVPQGRHYDFEVDAFMLSAFAQYDYQLSPRLSLLAGLRIESMQYDYDNLMLDGRTREDGSVCGFGGCRYSRPADSKDEFTNVTPKLGILFDLAEGHQLYANLSSGYRAPQANELYRLQRDQTVADLDSESLRSVEVGARGELDFWRYQFAAYFMLKENVIFRDSDFFSVSDGETSHRGIEFEGSIILNKVFKVDASVSYAEHIYENNALLNGVDITGNGVDTSPKLNAFASLNWQPKANLSLSLEWQHIDQYYLEPENINQYEGHDLLNIRSQWRINKDWMVYFNLENLSDEKYADRADFSGFTGERYFPGKPINYQLGIRKSW